MHGYEQQADQRFLWAMNRRAATQSFNMLLYSCGGCCVPLNIRRPGEGSERQQSTLNGDAGDDRAVSLQYNG